MADIASGVFDVVDGVLNELKASQLPKVVLEQFAALMARAQVREISEDALEKQAAEIDPKLGLLVKTRERPRLFRRGSTGSYARLKPLPI